MTKIKIKIIYTTTDADKIAHHIGELLVKNKLSPCVQIVPKIKTYYKWKGKLESSNELLLIIKATAENVNSCVQLILYHHNYDTPEIIVSEGDILHDKYADWFLDISNK